MVVEEHMELKEVQGHMERKEVKGHIEREEVEEHMEREEVEGHMTRKEVEVRKGPMECLQWVLGEHMREEHKKMVEEVQKHPGVLRTIQFRKRGRKELVGRMTLDS